MVGRTDGRTYNHLKFEEDRGMTSSKIKLADSVIKIRLNEMQKVSMLVTEDCSGNVTYVLTIQDQ